jgi:hypothetical protein
VVADVFSYAESPKRLYFCYLVITSTRGRPAGEIGALVGSWVVGGWWPKSQL